MKPAVTMTTAEVRQNLGKEMHPSMYKLKEVLCEPSGQPIELCKTKRRRARA